MATTPKEQQVPGAKAQTIDEAAREAGFALGAKETGREIMLAGFHGTNIAAFEAAAQAANRGGVSAAGYRLMAASDGICITITREA
jgi:hypothetical protein